MYMNYMTTTDLRTQSSELVEELSRGRSVTLVHRSKIIGEIIPKKTTDKTFDVKKFQEAIKTLHLPKLSRKQMEKNYREHIETKYGKGLS